MSTLQDLANLIARYSEADGVHNTAVPRLSIVRISRPSDPVHGVHKASICIVAQGRKQLIVADEVYCYEPSQQLLVSLDLPLIGQVIEASQDRPYLSMKLELDPATWAPASGLPSEDLHKEPYLSEAVLSDGGVYDNLGLETAWKKYRTVLVSNGGGKMQPQPDPPSDWARHGLRINDIIDNQVRSLRVRQLIGAFEAGERSGTYWGIRTCITDYNLPDALPCPEEQTLALAATPTRLKRMDAVLQERLINWGYAVCDAAMKRHVLSGAMTGTFPYAGSGVG